VQLGSDGLPSADGDGNVTVAQSYLFDEKDQGSHSLASSWDNGVLWVSSGNLGGSVLALNNGSFEPWTIAPDGRIALTEPIRDVVDLYVPEPSSMAALAGFGLGVLGLGRLRRRRA
jgi:hypothetical protein